MRILNRTQFLALPENTLFCKYKPCLFGDLTIKGETWGNDFQTQEIADAIESMGSDFHDKLFEAEDKGTSLRMDFHCMGRDGCFDAEQLFAIYERIDIEALISRLRECLK